MELKLLKKLVSVNNQFKLFIIYIMCILLFGTYKLYL